MKSITQLSSAILPSFLALAAGIIFSCFELSAQSNDSLQVNVDNSLTAAYNGSEGAIYNAVERHGKNFYRADILLGQEDLEPLLAATPYTYHDLEKYRRGFAAGKGLLIGFGALAGAGLVTAGVGAIGLTIEAITAGVGTVFMVPIFAMVGAPEAGVVPFEAKFAPVANAGAVIFCAGALGLIAGTTVFCVYKARLNKVGRSINDSSLQRLNLSFGAQRHGVGFALNF